MVKRQVLAESLGGIGGSDSHYNRNALHKCVKISMTK